VRYWLRKVKASNNRLFDLRRESKKRNEADLITGLNIVLFRAAWCGQNRISAGHSQSFGQTILEGFLFH